ncbi:hypothetical protein BJ878DRAFT_491435 [Calycina marina]|uniref:non-specific serine/threonine protein kinase n=1 Tax=Calycina marina TaxID=1763456 RepID=A0A9P7Z9Q3_9HELO|nr:hypothetical protein BJ878DRAFT_491435 [Calycina marina]
MDLYNLKTAASTPASSPGLFGSATAPATLSPIPSTGGSVEYLHPLQTHKVKETHKVIVDQDLAGRKTINQYAIVEEIGRGQHGKVKLAKNTNNSETVAIKIIQRYAKKRRLGKLTHDPEKKVKKEVAILKKVRHPNVVALLEVIDDEQLKKIYLVLEHVELGEIVWRKKGHGQVCQYEKRRLDREMSGEAGTEEEEQFLMNQERRRKRKDAQRWRRNQQFQPQNWSLEHNQGLEEQEGAALTRQNTRNSSQRSLVGSHPWASSSLRSNPVSRENSRAASRGPSGHSSRSHTPVPDSEFPLESDDEQSMPYHPGLWTINQLVEGGSYQSGRYGSFPDEDAAFRGRSPSMADSIISHMSSVLDFPGDQLDEDYAYVPCLTLEAARSTFRDTVLGLEYLHYEGIVHRDIKPANLLWTRDHRTKISDFGVSYFGPPIREDETEDVTEKEAVDFDDDRELAKTVGTPAFFAPELCYTDQDMQNVKVTEQIDVWSLGVTLYAIIYARLPFMSDDEYGLWNVIATQEVFLSKKRLMAVGPSPNETDQRLANEGPYRDEAELSFEDVDDELRDLLRRMLIKDPSDRIKLREVKRHPWVIQGIDNVMGWIDDTDPSRKTSGKRIIVDNAELEHAVVPVNNLLDRAKSVLLKSVNAIGSSMRRPRSATGSRKRAVSSVNSSEQINTPVTPIIRDSLSRRASMRGDEDLLGIVTNYPEHRITTEHPLAHSQTASLEISTSEDRFSMETAPKFTSVGHTPNHELPAKESDLRPGPADRAISTANSIQTVVYRGHSHRRSAMTIPPAREESSVAPGPFTDHLGNIFGGKLWTGKGPNTDGSSVTAADASFTGCHLFTSKNKQGTPSVAMSTAAAPGKFDYSMSPVQQKSPVRHQPVSEQLSPVESRPVFGPIMLQEAVDELFVDGICRLTNAGGPLTRFEVEKMLLPNYDKFLSFRKWSNTDPRAAGLGGPPAGATISSPDITPLNKDDFVPIEGLSVSNSRRRGLSNVKMDVRAPLQSVTNLPRSAYVAEERQGPGHLDQPSSWLNSPEQISHLASPLSLVSPISSADISTQNQAFRSAPSLPGLISSASSFCADSEGEFLQQPGVVSPQPSFSQANSTPEAISSKGLKKEGDTPMQTTDVGYLTAIAAEDDEDVGDHDTTAPMDDDDDDSDSDEGLVLDMSKKRKTPLRQMTMQRRGTNASVGSTETAKKIVMDQ